MSTRPKVLIFRSDYLPVSETFISDHLRTLRRYEPLVVCQRDMPVNHRTDHPVLAVGQGRIGRRLFENLGWSWSLDRLIAREKPTLVHAHFLTDAAKLLPYMERNRLPFVVTAHGYDATTDDSHLLKFREGALLVARRTRLMDRVDAVFCVSDFIREELTKRGFPERKLLVRHLGIETASQPARWDSSRRGVLTVGRLVEKKGTRFLIDAYARLPAALRDLHPLRVVGDGPLRSQLEAQAASLGLSVQFLGARPRNEVSALMQNSAVFAFPSARAESGDAEGMGIAVMEAMDCGLPVCLFDGQPIAPILRRHDAGLIAPVGDSTALAACIQSVLVDARVAEALCSAGGRALRQEFDLRANTGELEQDYERLAVSEARP